MNKLSQFRRWAEVAAGESPPTPDVVAAVAARLRQRTDAPWRLTYAFAGFSAALALLAALLGWQAFSALTQPWLGYVLPFDAGWLL